MRVLTQEEVIGVFGDYSKFLNSEGKATPSWEKRILTLIDLPAPLLLSYNRAIKVSRIRCHSLIAPFLKNALSDIHTLPEVWDTINDFGGVYEFRLQRKSKTLSRHCWAIAIDIDVGDNPFGREPKVHPKVVEIFNAHGFLWGGTFPRNRRDGMHFEFADIKRL